MQDREYLYGIYQRYLDGQATAAEEAELLRHFDEGNAEDLRQLVETAFKAEPPADWETSPEFRGIIHRVKGNLVPLFERSVSTGRKIRRIRRWLPYAAAMAVVAITIGWLLMGPGEKGRDSAIADIAPGGNRATLTLADGRVINLDETQTGIVVGTEDITYQDGTSLAAVIPPIPSAVSGSEVEGSQPNPRDAPVMLSLTTPKGGTYQITLPDGSKVWLNAASTLKYPSRFSADVREVFLEGEAFFAVSNQPLAVSHQPLAAGKEPKADFRQPTAERLPFRVVSKGQTVEVLGTQFNLSAYPDEDATKTTLVKGRVRVVGAQGVGANPEGLVEDNKNSPVKVGVVLTSGQQATTRGAAITVHDVDTDPYTAWKDGYFDFTDADIRTVMQEFARWYDIDVVFDGPQTKETFTGRIPRAWSLVRVMNMMGSFKSTQLVITGKEVTVKQ